MALDQVQLERLLCERLCAEIRIHRREDDVLMMESPFSADAPAVEAVVVPAGNTDGHALCHVARWTGARFQGLRPRDGSLIVKSVRGRRTALFRVVDGDAFDPARSGLAITARTDGYARGGQGRLDTLDRVLLGHGARLAERPARLAQVRRAQQLLNAHAVMAADALQDARRRLRPDRVMRRNHLMVLAALLRRDADMRTALTNSLVAHPAKRRHESGATQVTREPQATSTSSLT